MIKRKIAINRVIAQCACILFSFSSCVNDIQKEEEDSVKQVTLSPRIQQNKNSTDENEFNNNDEIGVYILTNSSNLDEERYIDNMRFTYTATNGFQPEVPVFFPEDSKTCDFICYYPYQSKGIAKNGTTMEVKTHSNQNERKKFDESDFMTAFSSQVSPTNQGVDLTFVHKLSKLNIIIEPETGFTADQLLEMNPSVTIKDVYTNAVYDFLDDSFKSHNTISDVQPYGNWMVEDGKLVGKTAILVPQEFADQHVLLEIRLQNREFQYVTEACELKSERPEDLIVKLVSDEQSLRCTLRTSISGWGKPEEKKVVANEVSTSIKLSTITFTDSNVYQVINKGKKVAEIAKEYLLGKNIDCQAIVVYPAINGETDLSKGIVASIINETDKKHGGSVAWNISDNSLTYTEGNSNVFTHIYITGNGEIQTVRPADALQIQAKPDVITDNRGTETIVYPIVKIGTQYWMRGNLKATKYTDGSDILNSKDFQDTEAKYAEQYGYYFYNSVAVNSELFSPSGWRVGNTSDWQKLQQYIQDDASVLKNSKTAWASPTQPITNYSGFNVVGTGYYNKNAYTSGGKQVCFWRMNNNSPYTTNGYIMLEASTNILKTQTNINALGLCVRCIRE